MFERLVSLQGPAMYARIQLRCLLAAAANGETRAVEDLLVEGVDPGARAEERGRFLGWGTSPWTPLAAAAQNGRWEAYRLLLLYGKLVHVIEGYLDLKEVDVMNRIN